MSNDLRRAVELIVKAGNTISKERPGVHGHAENSFKMIGDLWTEYLAHVFAVRNNNTIRPYDVARMMEMLKIARSIYGDPSNADNFTDSIGYAALAGMLQLPDRPFGNSAEQVENAVNDALKEIGNGNESVRQ